MSLRFVSLFALALLLVLSAPAPAATPTAGVPARPAAAKSAATKVATRKAGAAKAKPVFAPRLYLSWNAPWGEPRASARLEAPCSDSVVTDTLYLSFEPGKDAPGFIGASAALRFHGASEEWQPRGGGLNGTPLRVIFDSDPERGFVTPWSEKGAGSPFFDQVDGQARLRIIYAIAKGTGPGVKAGRRYGLARVLVRRPVAGSDGCNRAMCVEWRDGMLGYDTTEQLPVTEGERWVTINGGDAEACGPVRGALGAKPWKPKS